MNRYEVRFYNNLRINTEEVNAPDKEHARRIISELYPEHGDFVLIKRIKDMTTLIVDSKTGWGKCTNSKGISFTVLRGNDGISDLWNLSMDDPKDRFSGFWVKENVKRISTLQRFADEHDFDIEIKVI